MPAPICLTCRVVMRCVENECLVNDPRYGHFPRTFYFGDRFRCPGCRHEIVTGFGTAMEDHDSKLSDEQKKTSRYFVHNVADLPLIAQHPHTPEPV